MFFVLVAVVFTITVPMNVGAGDPEAPGFKEGTASTDEFLGEQYKGSKVKSGTVYIKSDGTIDPGTAPISKVGNIYTLTGNIYDNLEIQRSGITLDGDGYSIDGTYSGFGVYGNGVNNVTVKDLEVTEFYVGIRFDFTQDNTVTGCTVVDITRGGVVLWGSTCTRNTVCENDISECGWGIVVYLGPHHNTICKNSVYDCGTGINPDRDSHHNKIMDNKIADSYWYGIHLSNSHHQILKGNLLTNDGIHIWSDVLSNWNTHDIDTSNKANSKPIYYLKDRTWGCIKSGAGQVILANCQRVTVSNQVLKDCDVGISLGFSSKCNIYKNTVSCESYGIILESSDNNLVYSNEVSSATHRGWGIYPLRSDDNKIFLNTVTDRTVGIRTFDAVNTYIGLNKVTDSVLGVYLIYDGKNNVDSNELSENMYGIQVYRSNNNKIERNKFKDNQYIAWIQDSSENLIRHNTASNHEYGLILISFSLPSSDNLIACNQFSDTQTWGNIFLQDADDNSVKYNKVSKSDYGIWIWRSDDNEIWYNKATDNEYGIALSGSSHNTVKYNTVSDNDYGIYLEKEKDFLVDHSNNNNIRNNWVMSNNKDGIHIEDADEILVQYNCVKKNGDNGICIINTTNFEVLVNWVYYNNGNGIKVTESDEGLVKSNVVKDSCGYDLYWDEKGDVTWKCNWYKTKNW